MELIGAIAVSTLPGKFGAGNREDRPVKFHTNSLGRPVTSPLLRGFPPIVGGARVLTLGSFPSAQSLAARRHYANPRNAFWSITSELFGFEPSAHYDDRLAALQAHGVVLWDVLHKCRRVDRSDSTIQPKMLVINNFSELCRRLAATTE